MLYGVTDSLSSAGCEGVVAMVDEKKKLGGNGGLGVLGSRDGEERKNKF